MDTKNSFTLFHMPPGMFAIVAVIVIVKVLHTPFWNGQGRLMLSMMGGML